VYKIHIDKYQSSERERNFGKPKNSTLKASGRLSSKVVHFFGSFDRIPTFFLAKSQHMVAAHL